MAKAKHAKTIATHFPDALIPELDAFCRTHAITRSRALSLIVAHWYRSGRPAPTQEDADLLNRSLHPYLIQPQTTTDPSESYTPDEIFDKHLKP